MFYIYAHEDKKGEIIYIGQTVDFSRRLGRHMSHSQWGKEIYCAKVLCEKETEKEARFEEFKLINRYKPKYNIQNKHDGVKIDYLEVPACKFNDHGMISLDDYISLFSSKYEASVFNCKNPNFFYRLKNSPNVLDRYLDKNGDMYIKENGEYKISTSFSGVKPMVSK